MNEFLINHWSTILLCLVVLVDVFYLVWNKKWNQLRKQVYKAIQLAEKGFTGSQRGQQKFNYVLGQLYALIPGWLQFFISEESLREKLQQWYDEIKDYLDDGKLNNSVCEKKPPDTVK